MSITFNVPGVPVGKGRPRFSTAGKFPRAYTPEKTARYENLVAMAAQDAMEQRAPTSGAVTVLIEAYFPVPKSWSKNNRDLALRDRISPTTKPDADNLAKCICDAMNGIVYRDDSQVASLTVEKHYGAFPRVEVQIYTND